MKWSTLHPWLFPLGCAALYMPAMILNPTGTDRALDVCAQTFKQLGPPMCLAVTMMILLNRFLSPAAISRFLGQDAGLKGFALSSLAGILSMGPIYAWYPLFTTLKEKGASTFHIANFIGTRSVKPVLIPIMVAYFDWHLAALIIFMNFAGAFIVSGIVAMACPENKAKKTVLK